MLHNEFFAALKAGKIENCYLFEGEEEYTKKSALQALKKQIVTEDFAVMNDAVLQDPAPDELITAAETLPFMADKRFLLIRDCAMLTGVKSKNYDEETAVKRLGEYFDHLPETTCMVFYVTGKADGRKKFYQLLKKKAVIVTFSLLDDVQLGKWIAKQLKLGGRSVTSSVCQQIWFTAGRDLNLLQGEIDKLISYTEGKEEVTEKDILDICSQSQEYRVFDMSAALLDGNGRRAFELTKDILKNGEDRLFLLSLLGSQCRRLYYASEMRKKGSQEGEIASKLGIPPFAVRNTLRQAQRFTQEQLKNMCLWCLQTEYDVKSGHLAEEGSLENVMLRILALPHEK